MRQWHATLMGISAGRGRDVRVSRRLGAGHGRSGAGWSCARRKGNTTPPSCDSRKRSSLSSGRRGASSHGVPGRPSQAGRSAVFRLLYTHPGLDAPAASLSAVASSASSAWSPSGGRVSASAADGRASPASDQPHELPRRASTERTRGPVLFGVSRPSP